MAEEGGKTVEHQAFTQPYIIHPEEGVKVPPILVPQKAFLLFEADYLRLKYGASKVMRWAETIFIIGVGLLLNPIAKFMQAKSAQSQLAIESWEWFAPVIAFILALILFAVGLVLPSDKKRVMKDIEAEFSEGATSGTSEDISNEQ